MRRLLLVLLAVVLPATAIADKLPEGEPAAPAGPPNVEDPPVEPPPVTPPTPPAAPIETPLPRGPEPVIVNPADRPPPAGLRLMLSDLTILRLNPLGLETRARLGFQKRLFKSDKAITRNNFAFGGLYPKLNPASAQLGIGGELQPASILNVKAYYEIQKFFGTFGYLQSFPTANANFSDATLKEMRDDTATPPQSATIHHLSIQPLLQLKVGPLAIRALFQFDYWNYKVRPGDTVAYEATFDTLLPNNGWTLSIDTDVLYMNIPKLAIGLRHSLVKPFYSEENFANAAEFEAYDGENAHQRVGLFAAYTLNDRGPSTFNKPTILLIASMYLSHRWRTGEPGTIPSGERPDDYTSRAFPYLLVGFAFESDLLSVR